MAAAILRDAHCSRDAGFVAVGFNVPVAEMHTAQSLAREKKIPPAASNVLGEEFDQRAAIERLLGCAEWSLATPCCGNGCWPG